MDDWEKRYWQKKQQQMQQGGKNPSKMPHYEPAHITQDRHRTQNPGNGWKDVDPLSAMYANMNGLSARGMGPQVQTVMIRPGTKYYKAVQTESFGSTVPLVRICGAYNEQTTREFEMLSECRCYVIDDLQTVDLSKMESNRMIELVQVRAPFIGTILVDSKAIVSSNGSNKGPQVLKG